MAGVFASSIKGLVSGFEDAQVTAQLAVTKEKVAGFSDTIQEKIQPLTQGVAELKEDFAECAEDIAMLELLPAGYTATLIRTASVTAAGSQTITGASAKTVALIVMIIESGTEEIKGKIVFLRKPEQTQATENVYNAIMTYNSNYGGAYNLGTRSLTLTSGGGNYSQYKLTWGAGYYRKWNQGSSTSGQYWARVSRVWRIDRA